MRIISTIIVFFIATLCSQISAQEKLKQKAKIFIEKADSLQHKDKIAKDVKTLIGHVRLRHQNTLLYCDSAYMYSDSNLVIAYKNIHIIQNDSIHLYGDYLEYEGSKSLAKVRENVRMVKGDVTLTTEYLDYDRANDVAYYFEGGKIVNKQNTLISDLGYYYPNANEVFFKDSVVVENPKYTIFSDTLKYHTVTEVVKILGPTHIVSDDNVIYSEDGYYDTKKDIALLKKNSYVQGKEQILKGDTIYYKRNKGIGEVFNNMELKDTTNNIIIKGDYGFYNELTKRAFATQKALLLQVYQNDTLFMHADTLRIDPVTDTLTNAPSRLARAFHNVKFFRRDMQGRCDSMVYDFRDSINTFFHDPVIWAQGNQMTAHVIKLYTKNQTLDKMEMIDDAFIIAPEDSLFFNQIKGKHMMAYVRNNDLYKIDVDGNAQTIYHPKDKQLVIGVNRAESSNLTIFMKNNQVDNLIMRGAPDGNMNPPLFLPDEDVKLKGFRWLELFRPKRKEDIFIHVKLPEKEESTTIYQDFEIGEIKTKAPKKRNKITLQGNYN